MLSNRQMVAGNEGFLGGKLVDFSDFSQLSRLIIPASDHESHEFMGPKLYLYNILPYFSVFHWDKVR